MTIGAWIISLCALGWLAVMWLYERGQNAVLHPLWIILPFLVAAAYRLLGGPSLFIAAAAAIVLLAAERKHLQNRLLEMLIVITAIIGVSWILFTMQIPTAYGVVGIIVFWLSWELHAIEGKDAIVLITCQILWPGLEYITVCLAVVLGWALIARIREGGWLKRHAMPGTLLILISAGLFILYSAYQAIQK
jgi:hypothetical protein